MTNGGRNVQGRVRRAVVVDADRIAACHLACWREAYVDLLSPAFLAGLDVTERAAFWREALADPAARSAVAEVDGELIGFAHAVAGRTPAQGSDVELSAIYVREAFHGGGTAELLFEMVVGNRPCSLWVAEVNPRAHAFYRRQGFHFDGQRSTIPQWENLPIIHMLR
jgi:GNAT superfamily N-acetyltransferase